MPIPGQKFELGQIVCSREVAETRTIRSSFTGFLQKCLRRHAVGDWGDISDEDKKQNEYALDKRLRLFSSYNYGGGDKVWVITEADRSSTCILFPDEY